MDFIRRWKATIAAPQDNIANNITIKNIPEPLRCKRGVIHIGAHRCEEASQYSEYPKVLWIDGNDDLCAEYPQIVNAIISDEDDKDVEFMITSNDAMSSSILKLKEHRVEHPDCVEVKNVLKKSVTLDTLLTRQGYKHDDFDMLVMDIQGAELLALKGACHTLEHINVIVTEVNTKELYEGCVMLPELDDYLKERGFLRVDTQMTRHGWGDAIYLRRLLTMRVHSGLGNRLFHLASLYGIAKKTKSLPVLFYPYIEDIKVHTKDHWIYKPFYDMFPIYHGDADMLSRFKVVREHHMQPGVYVDYQEQIVPNAFVMLEGYFQSDMYFSEHSDHIKEFFRNALNVNDIEECNAYFVHIRGRDHGFKWDKMEEFYARAKKRFGDKKPKVYTDDPDFAEDLGFYMLEPPIDELATLKKMISCKVGGICCNSTFSWWAAFLGNGENYIVPYPFNLKLRCDDIYLNKMIKVGITDMTKNLVNTRYVNGQLTMIFIDKIYECNVNGIKCKTHVFDKTTHNDSNYNEFTVCTCLLGTECNKATIDVYGQCIDVQLVHENYKEKYGLVAMTMVNAKDLELVSSYVQYHHNHLGVEKFYVYVNDQNIDVNVLDTMDGLVIYQHWPYPYLNGKAHYAQIGALTDFLYYAKHMANYVLFSDVDEYIKWKLSMKLKTFIDRNDDVGCFAFMNRFVKLHDANVDCRVHERILHDEYRASDQIYSYKNRSKCIIRTSDVEAMGIHCVMKPDDCNILDFGYEAAEMLHICNLQNRVHVSVSQREKLF